MTRDVRRIPDVLTALQQVWEANPDLRLAQLILNLAFPEKLYYVEDDVLVDWLYELYEVC